MGDFVLVTEGVTDHTILKNVLIGYFKNQREPEINFDQPDVRRVPSHGGWTLVIQSLRERKYRQAFQFNQFVTVQIDTDVSGESGFGVPRQDVNGPMPVEEFIPRVIDRLKAEIAEEDLVRYSDRFIFAIGVDQLECWLLPLWFKDSKGKQTSNCTNRLGECPQLRDELNRKRPKLPWIRPEEKDQGSYDVASKGYKKRATLIADASKNPSLAFFIELLDQQNIILEDTN